MRRRRVQNKLNACLRQDSSIVSMAVLRRLIRSAGMLQCTSLDVPIVKKSKIQGHVKHDVENEPKDN